MSTKPKKIDLIGVGSPVVDLVARVDDAFVEALEGGKGGMVLIEAIDLEELVSSLENEPEVAPGGSAGNTAYAAAKIGSRVSFVGKLGDCEAATFYKDRFRGVGADVSRFKIGEIPNARCLSLVTSDSQRTMRTDLGAAMTLTPEEISTEDFKEARHVHMEGYLAFNRGLMEKVLRCAKDAECTTSFDLASYEVVRATEDVLEGWLTDYIDIVFANEDEAAAFFPNKQDDYGAMAEAFADLCHIGAIKLGKDGSILAREDELVRVSAMEVDEALDTTGAGDFFAGGFLTAWLQDKPLDECGRYGSILGAEVVKVLGASLDEEEWKQLNDKL